VDFTISNTLLSEGFHLLVIRTQDATGLWGVQESTVFYVSPGDPMTTATVDAAEYYLDTDPGYGNGTSITVESGTPISTDFVVPNASISTGFHSLVIRLQDSDGQWGVQESKAFYVSNSDPAVISNIVAAEYYLDIDPGHGNGTTITVSAAMTIDTDFIIPNADISEGFHSLVIRCQDAEGLWGMEQKTAFYVTNSDPIVTAEVVAAEYYLDTDPGVGSGTALTVVAGTMVDMDFTISNSVLTEGFHSLVIRIQDAEGQWGVQEATAVYVSNTNPLETTLITDLEYFIDVDPGVGSATPVAVTDIVAFDVDATVLTNTLSAGMHMLHIRAKDQMGVWSMMESKIFLVDEFISGALVSAVSSKVASLEYFIGDDPGYGLGTQVTISPPLDAIDEDLIAASSALPFGDYILGVRVANEVGFYSQTEYVPFAICDGAQILVNVDNTCLGSATIFTDMSTGVLTGDVYSWDFDGDGTEDDNTVGDASFTYSSVGDYTGSLTISNSNCTATQPFSTTVIGLPVVVANTTLNTVCLGGEVTLTGSGASTYSWDQTVEDGVVFSPSATLNYTVTGTDAAGCVATDMVEVSVVESSTPTLMNEVITCLGSSTIFTDMSTGVIADDVYSWDFDGDGVEDDNTVGDASFTYSSVADYTGSLTISNSNCTATQPFSISVVDLPVVAANTTLNTVCLGNEVTLTGTGASTYSWDQTVEDGVVFSPTATLTYTVTGTDAAGCVATDMVEISVVEPNKPTLVNEVTTCLGNATIFTDMSTGVLAGDVYSWDFDGDGVEDDNTIGDASFTYSRVADYSGSLTISNSNCTATQPFSISVVDLPVVAANTTLNTVCLGNEVTLTGSGASTYSWDQTVEDGVVFSPSATLTYTVTGTDAAGCVATDMVEISVVEPNKPTLVNEVTTCLGNATIFTDMSTGVLTGDVYSWDFDGDGLVDDNIVGDASFTYSSVADYTGSLTISNSNCTATLPFSISVVGLPIVVANTSWNTVCFGGEVTLTGSGASTYSWDQGVENRVAFSPLETLTYTVTGTDAAGCIATDMVEISVIELIKPTISVNNDNISLVILQSSASTGNQWFLEGIILVGETNQTIKIDEPGNYSVKIIDGECSVLSDVLDVFVLGIGDEDYTEVSIWPNPVDQQLTIQGLKTSNITITVVNLTGTIVMHQEIDLSSEDRFSIDTSHLSSGIYLLAITGYDHPFKFLKR
ncbi:MAG: T9SS type A sorting domain-containing protein, partial [Reichenbachiella sp.]